MRTEDAAKVLADAEALGLIPPEREASRLADRAEVWGRVLGDATREELNAALVRLARHEIRGFIRPFDLVRIASEQRWVVMGRERRERESELALAHNARMKDDPAYRAEYEKSVEAAKDAVRNG